MKKNGTVEFVRNKNTGILEVFKNGEKIGVIKTIADSGNKKG